MNSPSDNLVKYYSSLKDDLSEVKTETKHVIYKSEIIINKNDNGRYRTWSFIIESDIDLTPSHLDNIRFPNKCFYKSLYGMIGSEGKKNSYPTMSSGKSQPPSNVGKKNELNQLLRLIAIGNKDLDNKIKKEGYQIVSKVYEDKVISFKDLNLSFDSLPVPEKFKSSGTPDFPLFASIKYDGVSLIMCYHEEFTDHYNNIIAYTRNRKVALGFKDLKDLLIPVLKANPGLFVAGEFCKNKVARNKVNSIHSQNVSGTLTTSDMDYVLFDCFYPIPPKVDIKEIDTLLESYNDNIDKKEANDEAGKALDKISYSCLNDKTGLLYDKRQDLLKKLVDNVNNSRIRQAEYYKFDNINDLNEFNEQIIADDHEGLVIHKNCAYMFSFKKFKVNPKVFKLKKFYDKEYKIVGYHFGKGNAEKKVIFTCVADNGDEFNVDINFDDESMEKVYNNIKKDPSFYNGMLAVVKYETISEYGIPLLAKVVDILDPSDQYQ